MTTTYLYAIVPSAKGIRLGHMGLPDGKAPIAAVAVDGLVALTSEYSGLGFAEAPRAELLPLLTIHQKVIEAAMVGGPTLPAKFGTTLSSEHEVRAVLGHFRDRFHSAFHHLGNGVEIEVAATWDLGRTFSEIGREPDIACLVSQAPSLPPEQAHALRVQVGELVKQALDRRRGEYRERLIHAVSPVVVDGQPNALLADELVLNVAFLVARQNLDSFYARLHQLDAALGSRLTFRCIGPLPPYSFATISFLHPDRHVLDEARRLLKLSDSFSEADVHASYRRLAASCHPDRNPSDITAGERFAALATASSALLSHLRGCRTTPDGLRNDLRHDSRSAAEALPLLEIQRTSCKLLRNDCWEQSYVYNSVA